MNLLSNQFATMGKRRPVISSGDITNGLVGQWRTFSGTTATDSSGNGNDGTLVGTPTISTGPSGGQALTLNGSSQYVTIPNAAVLQTGDAMSISLWVKPVGALSTRQGLYATANNNAGMWLEIGTFAGLYTNGIATAINGTFVCASSGSLLATGNWYHIVYTRSAVGSGTHALYLNGSPVSIVSSGSAWNDSLSYPTQSSTPEMIGARALSSQLLNGVLADLRHYNRALSSTEAATLYSNGAK